MRTKNHGGWKKRHQRHIRDCGLICRQMKTKYTRCVLLVDNASTISSNGSNIVKELIKEGEKLTLENLTLKRPGTGIKPKHLNSLLGKKVKTECKADSLLEWSNIVD